MERKSSDKSGEKPGAPSRDERRKAALRANLQRRKAQARARDAHSGDDAQEKKD